MIVASRLSTDDFIDAGPFDEWQVAEPAKVWKGDDAETQVHVSMTKVEIGALNLAAFYKRKTVSDLGH